MTKILYKTIRIIAILLMGLTAGFTLLSGAGTTCVALAAEKFGDKMALISPYKWLYVLFVLITLAIGVLGVRATIQIIKGRASAYRSALLALLSGTVIGVIHIIVSRSLRGASMPVDAVVYTTVFTLIVFLLLRIPPVWAKIDFEKNEVDQDLPRSAAAITAILFGVLTLTVQDWAGPTHMLGGINYADAWHDQLAVIGWGLMLFGLAVLIKLDMWSYQSLQENKIGWDVF